MADTYLEPNIPRNRPQVKPQPRQPEPDSEPEPGPKLTKRKPHREEVGADEPDVSAPTKPRETWFERNRNLIFFGIAILIVLVILLIWHLFSRQPTPRVVAVVPGQGSRAGPQSVPPKTETNAEPAAPSENVDEAEPAEKPQPEAEQEVREDAQRSKPAVEPKAKPAASNSSKGKTPQAEPKTPKGKPRAPVTADTIVTADDEEINKFAGMSAEASEPGKME